MSYILDALKRAEAERQRGAVPGLHAQQLSPSVGKDVPVIKLQWWWIVGSVLLTLCAVLAYRSVEKSETAALVVPVPVAESVASIPQAITPHIVRPVANLPSVAMPPPPGKAKASTQVPTSPKPDTPVHEAKALQSAPAEVPKLSELPDEIRRQIPALTINGSVYSDNPAQRLLVVNGQVQSQGGQMGSTLKLEEIGVKSSVFSFSGTRFKVPH